MIAPRFPNVLVVGGTGFLGWHAVQAFLRRGYRVRVVALPPLPAENLLPTDVEVYLTDINVLGDEELLALLDGQDALVFAAGVDDRVIPPKPAYPFFYWGNVAGPARLFHLARQAGVRRAILLSSYFVYFAHLWPKRKLAERHPYIRSRIEQIRACIRAGAPEMEVIILGLPYIFGAMPGRIPLWKPLVDYLRARRVVFYTRGGTACVSVQSVAQAIVGAVERGQSGTYYLIGDANLSWEQMLLGLAEAAGLKRRIVIVPNFLVRLALLLVKWWHSLRGKESGLDPAHLADIQTAETFFDPEPARRALGFAQGNLQAAFAETVKACSPPLSSPL